MKFSRIIFLLVILCVAHPAHVYAWGTDAIKEGMTEAAKISSEALKEAAKDAAPKFGLEAAKELAQAAPKASAKFGVEGAEKVANAVKDSSSSLARVATGAVWAFGVFSGAYAVKQLWDMSKDVKSYVSPSMKEKARELEYMEKYALLKSKKELKECLTSKSAQKKGALGLPSDCENFAHAFAKAAGDDELDKLTRTFNKHYVQ